jgi:hypothetical protein
MHKYIYFIVVVFSLLWVAEASALTLKRYASVEIIDGIGGIKETQIDDIKPVLSSHVEQEKQAASEQAAKGSDTIFTKKMTIPEPKASGNKPQAKYIEQYIEGEYVISGSRNNSVQLSASGQASKNNEITFKAVQASYKTGNTTSSLIKGAPGYATGVKLASIVKISTTIGRGKYSPAIQLSANYE